MEEFVTSNLNRQSNNFKETIADFEVIACIVQTKRATRIAM